MYSPVQILFTLRVNKHRLGVNKHRRRVNKHTLARVLEPLVPIQFTSVRLPIFLVQEPHSNARILFTQRAVPFSHARINVPHLEDLFTSLRKHVLALRFPLHPPRTDLLHRLVRVLRQALRVHRLEDDLPVQPKLLPPVPFDHPEPLGHDPFGLVPQGHSAEENELHGHNAFEKVSPAVTLASALAPVTAPPRRPSRVLRKSS